MVKPDAEFVLTTAAILTAVVTVVAKGKEIWKGICMTARWITDRINLPGKVLRLLESQGKAIAEIQAEIRPNGGDSIKDTINEIRTLAHLADVRSHLSREVCPFAMYECDPTGSCVWVNEALCQLFGITAEDALGYGWLAGVSEEERKEALRAWEFAVENHVPYSATYTVTNQKTGVQTRCRTRATAYKRAGVTLLFSGTVLPETLAQGANPHG